jgi:hypothetical protein
MLAAGVGVGDADDPPGGGEDVLGRHAQLQHRDFATI